MEKKESVAGMTLWRPMAPARPEVGFQTAAAGTNIDAVCMQRKPGKGLIGPVSGAASGPFRQAGRSSDEVQA